MKICNAFNCVTLKSTFSFVIIKKSKRSSKKKKISKCICKPSMLKTSCAATVCVMFKENIVNIFRKEFKEMMILELVIFISLDCNYNYDYLKIH